MLTKGSSKRIQQDFSWIPTMHVIGDKVDARRDQATANKDDNRGAGGEARSILSI
jgi:hypothetical protein